MMWWNTERRRKPQFEKWQFRLIHIAPNHFAHHIPNIITEVKPTFVMSIVYFNNSVNVFQATQTHIHRPRNRSTRSVEGFLSASALRSHLARIINLWLIQQKMLMHIYTILILIVKYSFMMPYNLQQNSTQYSPIWRAKQHIKNK